VSVVEAPVQGLTGAPADTHSTDMIRIPRRHLPHGIRQALSRRSTRPPRHRRRILDTCTPVTNRQLKKFVRAAGHVTFAEIAPDAKNYPGALPHNKTT
jgi:hypothetical protein